MAACAGYGVAIGGALMLGAVACSGPPGAGRQLGDDLGGYRVAASEVSNGCGAGALGSQPSFGFDIDLARESSQLFWGHDAGVIDAHLGFEFQALVRVPVVPPSATSKGCAIGRTDHISGTLRADGSGEVLGFSGRMSHSFQPDTATSCSLDDQIKAGLPRLPCEMTYALEADRTREPD